MFYGLKITVEAMDGTVVPTDTIEDLDRVFAVLKSFKELMANAKSTPTSVPSPQIIKGSTPSSGLPTTGGTPPESPANRFLKRPGELTMPQWIAKAWEAAGRPAEGISGPELYKIAVDKCHFESTAKDPVGAFTTSIRQDPHMQKLGVVGKTMMYSFEYPPQENEIQLSAEFGADRTDDKENVVAEMTT